jgi:hypothetical protein
MPRKLARFLDKKSWPYLTHTNLSFVWYKCYGNVRTDTSVWYCCDAQTASLVQYRLYVLYNRCNDCEKCR